MGVNLKIHRHAELVSASLATRGLRVKPAMTGVLSLFLILLFAACGNDVAVPIPQPAAPKMYEESEISVNQEIVRREQADIALVAKRYNWNVTQTSSGLLYEILNKKNGDFPHAKDKVQIKGKIYLQDGTVVYDDKTDGIKEFIIDRSDDPVGLHELVKLMCEGGKSRAIIPTYLAYGIAGDGEQIPALSFLICEIELVKISE